MKGTVVYVRWVDSTGRFGWQTMRSFREGKLDGLICTTIGFLVREDPETISIAQSLAFHEGPDEEPDSIDNPLTIPRSAILGLWEVTGVH